MRGPETVFALATRVRKKDSFNIPELYVGIPGVATQGGTLEKKRLP